MVLSNPAVQEEAGGVDAPPSYSSLATRASAAEMPPPSYSVYEQISAMEMGLSRQM